jgi:hypothetical protein
MGRHADTDDVGPVCLGFF